LHEEHQRGSAQHSNDKWLSAAAVRHFCVMTLQQLATPLPDFQVTGRCALAVGIDSLAGFAN
jgi:hypothetical protein